MLISKKIKLADIIHHDNRLVPIINRFGIQFGFGDRTIEEICVKRKINTNFLLEILNAFHDEEYIPDKNLPNFSFYNIVDYLSRSHKYYNTVKIPDIEKLIDKLIWSDISQKQNKELLKNFFDEYSKKVNKHTNYEENKIYPYMLEIESSLKKKYITEKLEKKILKYPIKEYAKEHSDLDSALIDLKNIIIKYLPPPDNPIVMNKILSEIFRLEKELKDHTRIEEHVLIPKVKEIEKEILKFKKKN